MSLYAELNLFPIAFWHPFGPHGDEGPKEILNRKLKECAEAGETFWAFRSVGEPWVKMCREVIRKHNSEVCALCIYSESNKDFVETGANSKIVTAAFWQRERGGARERIHPKISATFKKPLGTHAIGSAFRVAAVDVLEPHAYVRRRGRLLKPGFTHAEGSAEGSSRLGRGQKFVQFVDRSGNDGREWNGEVAAVLRLKEPWVVWICKD